MKCFLPVHSDPKYYLQSRHHEVLNSWKNQQTLKTVVVKNAIISNLNISNYLGVTLFDLKRSSVLAQNFRMLRSAKKTFLRYISNGSETPYVCYFIIFKDCSSLSQRCKICHIYILICYNSVVLPVLLDPIQNFPNSVVSETHIQGHHINTNMKVKIKSKKFQTFNFNIFWS